MWTYDEWVRWRTCTRKRPHALRLDANWEVLRYWQQGRDAAAYVCPYCGLFHVTTTPGAFALTSHL